MLSYNGRKIIPAPFVTVNKQFIKSGDGSKIGVGYQISLRGTLVAFSGSPSGHYPSVTDSFWTGTGYPPDEEYQGNNEDFHSIIRKQEAIRWLFAEEGKSLEWQPSAGQPVVRCNPRVIGITFEEGQWVNTCPFTVELEADRIYLNGTLDTEDSLAFNQIQDGSEEWAFDEIPGNEGKAYTVTHTVSATAKIGYNELGSVIDSKTAWEHAKDWCNSRIGIDLTIEDGAIGETWAGGSYEKTVSLNESAGTFAVTEKWIVSESTSYTEKTFEVSYAKETDSYSVQYNGIIYGNAANSKSGAEASLNAAKASIPSDAAAVAEANAAVASLIGSDPLSSSPSSKTIGLNQKEGTVNFSFAWNTTEETTHGITWEASLNYSYDTDQYSLSVSVNIEGYGETAAERLANAKAAMPTEAEARAKGLEIIGDQLPDGYTIGTDLKSKAVSINEKAATIQCSWSWDSGSTNSVEITVQTTTGGSIVAILPVPGRSGGPVMQDMSTKNESYVTVSYQGKNFDSKPNVTGIMDGYGQGGWVVSDEDNWSPTNKTYSRTRKYLLRS